MSQENSEKSLVAKYSFSLKAFSNVLINILLKSSLPLEEQSNIFTLFFKSLQFYLGCTSQQVNKSMLILEKLMKQKHTAPFFVTEHHQWAFYFPLSLSTVFYWPVKK